MGWREKGREGKIYMGGREEGRKGGKEGKGYVSMDVFSLLLLDIKQKCLYLTTHYRNV